MSAVTTSDVLPFKGAERRPPPDHKLDRAAQIMASIQGEDHKRLADLLDYRVGELEGKVEATSTHVQTVATAVANVAGKVDTLISLHKGSKGADSAQEPKTVVGLINKHPWLLPVMMLLGAILFGSTAVMQFLDRG